MIGARPAQTATALPDTNPPSVHIRTKGRLMYGANWPIANQSYRRLTPNTTRLTSEIATYSHGINAGVVAPRAQ